MEIIVLACSLVVPIQMATVVCVAEYYLYWCH